MVQYIDKNALVAEIEKRYEYWREKEFNSHSIESETRMSECQHLMLLLTAHEVKVMAQYIDKNALVAGIEKLKADTLQKKSQCRRNGLERIMHQIVAYNKVISLINTLSHRNPTAQ